LFLNNSYFMRVRCVEAYRYAKHSDTALSAAAALPPGAPTKAPPTTALTIAAPPIAWLDWLIVREFPLLFTELRAKQWALL
jgi:hypothetical protein